ncbi:hypothetical protein PG993_002381 [Apiospora rasikravindrae]|uniref:Uncharacterized protein n=1 Tax=Apiospora rasikravindrae TaxID=990691 RepID=A0ABR1TWG4_9PEZI
MRLPTGLDFEPTEGVPLADDAVRTKLQHMDKGCMGDLWYHLMNQAREKMILVEDGVFKDRSSMKRLLRNDKKGHSVSRMLLYSIPKKLLSDVFLGKFSHQAKLPEDDPLSIDCGIYHRDGPGAYVVTIAVEGRKGAWLTGAELQMQIEKIDLYLKADEEQTDMIEYTRRIDRYYCKDGCVAPVYTAVDQARGKIEQFRRSLARLASLAKAETPLVQAPCYVGCSSDATRKRNEKHFPDTNWTRNKGNYTWWLTLSCMRDMVLEPEPSSTRDDPKRSWIKDKEATEYYRPWYLENMRDTRDTFQKREVLLDFIDSGKLDQYMTQIEQQIDRVEILFRVRDKMRGK